MTPIPKDPTGPHGIVQTIREILRCLREREIIKDPSVEITRTPEGTRIKAKGAGRGGTGGGDQDEMVWL